jgi:selenocysteine-specific elongation factor
MVVLDSLCTVESGNQHAPPIRLTASLRVWHTWVMFVITTAGHVDHGKSTLIHALSGIHPDRLKEEKARGMTIELGFAWVTLPSGREISMVDVPGHERFVRNMLMGVGGVDFALMIVAADEGVMPQTREHLAILDLLNVERGITVITKSDLVDEEWLELVSGDVEDLLEGTTLQGSPLVAVSAETGNGVPELLAKIDAQLNQLDAHADLGRPRLPVDRAFTMSGFGAVITGTLTGGKLQAGQEVVLLPGDRRARIRGLQSHRATLGEALPGTRVAVNLSGIEHNEIERGDLLTVPGWLESSNAFDASLRVISAAPRPVRHNHRLLLFAGSREVPVKVRVLEGDRIAPGESGWVQLRTTGAVPMLRGDRFILRNTQDTLAGGVVLVPEASRHRRNDPAIVVELETLASGSDESAVLQTLRSIEPATVAELGHHANLSANDAKELAEQLVESDDAIDIGTAESVLLYSAQGWATVRSAAENVLSGYHASLPLRPGMPREELRNRLKLKAGPFLRVVNTLERENLLMHDGALLWLPSHTVELNSEQQQRVNAYLASLATDPYSPPTDTLLEVELLAGLESKGTVVRASEVVYLGSAFSEMEKRVSEHAAAGGQININEVRELFGSSRKYVLAFLEELDRRGVTIRRGDDRILRGK